RVDVDVARQSVLADLIRLHEFLSENFAGRDGFKPFWFRHCRRPFNCAFVFRRPVLTSRDRALVIIHNLDLFSAAVVPHEADPPLIVDADRMLPLAVAFERFQPVAWRVAQIAERAGAVKQEQLAAGLPLDAAETRHVLVREQASGRRVTERADHSPMVFYLTE